MRFSPALLLAAALTLSLAAPAEARLSGAEQSMIRTVDAEQARTLGMLETWVDQNSGTLNVAGVTAVGKMLRAELEPLGFKVEWIDMSAAGRAGHIVARHAGSPNAKKLLLIGHLDTVFELDSPFQRWVREGDKAHGPGAGDDKGGMAVMVAALRAMNSAGTLKRADITIVLTGDEEDAGSRSRSPGATSSRKGRKRTSRSISRGWRRSRGRPGCSTWARSRGAARAAGR